MKKYFTLENIMCAMLLIVFFWQQQPDLDRWQMYFGTLFTTFLCSIAMMRRTGSKLLGFAFGVFLYGGLRIFIDPEMHYEPDLINITDSLSARSTVVFMMICFSVVMMFEKEKERIFDALKYICLASSVIMIYRYFTGDAVYSFMNNPAADASMLAVLYPILAMKDPYLSHLKNDKTSVAVVSIPLIAIGLAGSVTGFLTVFLILLSIVLQNRKAIAVVVCSILALGFAPAYFLLHHSINFTNGRLDTWKLMLAYWSQHADIWLGAGADTYFFFGQQIQLNMQWDKTHLFGFLHNDYLEILHNYGALGLVTFLVVGIVALKKAYGRIWLFCSLIAYGFIMLAQYPLKFWASAFVGAMLLREAYSKETPGQTGKS